MTDNEKRAHDLAVALCIETYHLKAKSKIAAGETNVSVDIFAEYLKAYELGLKAFNEKFPNGEELPH